MRHLDRGKAKGPSYCEPSESKVIKVISMITGLYEEEKKGGGVKFCWQRYEAAQRWKKLCGDGTHFREGDKKADSRWSDAS